MRDDWQNKKLAQVSGFQNGFAFKSKTFKEEGIPVIRITNIQDQSIDFSKVVYVNPKDYDKDLTKYHIVKGDLLIAMSGATTGKIGINNSDNIALLNQRVGKFEPNEDLLKLFLYYFLSTKVEESLSISAGSAQPNLSTDQIKNFEIPIPPIEEQKEIIEILDQAFESIEKARANIEKNIQNAEELFKSMLNQIFFQAGEGWEQDIMVNLCDVLTCGVASTPKYVDESVGVPFLSAQNVKNGKVVLHKYRYISKEFHEHLTKKNKPTKGDILYTRVGAKFGEAAVVEHDFDFSVYVSLTLIRPNAEKLNNYYFKYYLNSPSIKSLAKSSITSSGVPNLNVKTVRDFPVFYPDLNKQKEIVETLDTIDNHIQSLLTSYEEELKNLEELKKSILQKAFSGELTNKNKAA